jgi:hypothetical protein
MGGQNDHFAGQSHSHCAGVGALLALGRKKQVPDGNDRQKSKGKNRGWILGISGLIRL